MTTLRRLASLLRLALTGGAFCLTAPAQAETFIAPPVVALEYGVVCDYNPQGTDVPAPDTNAGRVRSGGPAIVFDLHTDQVPARLGIAFGIHVTFADDAGDHVVTMVTRHPSFGPGYMTEESWPSTMSSGESSARYFYFEFDYELAAGPWSMEILLDGGVVARQDFTVHDGPVAQAILDTCPTEGLLS